MEQMKQMIRMIILSLRVRFAIIANRVLHFLRGIYGFKSMFPYYMYGDSGLKIVFTIFGVIFIVTKRIMYRFFYVAFVFAIGIAAFVVGALRTTGGFFEFSAKNLGNMDFSRVFSYVLFAWFILSFLGSYFGARLSISTLYRHDDIMIRQMGADGNVYARSNILLDLAGDVLLYLPYLLLGAFLGGMTLWGVFVILMALTAFGFLGEFLQIVTFQLRGKLLGTWIEAMLGIPVLLAALLVPAFLGVPNWSSVLGSPFVFVGVLLLGGFPAYKVLNYKNYTPLLKSQIAHVERQMTAMANINSSSNYVDLRGAKSWSKDVTQEDLGARRFEKKQGFAYLNAIFFDRHSKFFKKKVRLRVLAILAAGFVLSVIGFDGRLVGAIPFLGEDVFESAPALFFVLYLISMGRIVAASVFSNCDIQMLHYPYYRTRETIFASFKARFLATLRYNFLISTVLSFSAICAFAFIIGAFWPLDSLVLFLLLTAMGIFFSFNDLFLYYLFQPFDSEGQIKSFAYRVMGIVIYLFAYVSFMNRFPFYRYSAIMFVIFVLYLGIGMLLLFRYAPKNFKLR